mgnify:CR=1 FL=1
MSQEQEDQQSQEQDTVEINPVESLVDSILDGDAVNSKSQFEDLMGDRINDYIDASKQTISSNLFNDPSEVEEVEDEETEEVYVEHMCAKHVLHPEYGEGVVLEGQHALPDEDGNISWYTVQFNHGTETIETEDVKIMHESHHGHMMKKKKRKVAEKVDESNDAMDRINDDLGDRHAELENSKHFNHPNVQKHIKKLEGLSKYEYEEADEHLRNAENENDKLHGRKPGNRRSFTPGDPDYKD